jgi:hypothetical protein
MNREYEKFEDYLREFEPLKPGALRDGRESWLRWRRLAAAAALLVATGASAWMALTRSAQDTKQGEFVGQATIPEHRERHQFTLGELKRLTEESEQLESVLVSASRRELPDFRENKSALRFLAKE